MHKLTVWRVLSYWDKTGIKMSVALTTSCTDTRNLDPGAGLESEKYREWL